MQETRGKKMALRDYECSSCSYYEERNESITVKPKICKCPNCNKKTFRVVILTAPRCKVIDIKTIGQLADSNWKKMGRYEREEKLRDDKVQESIDKRDRNIRRNKIAKMTPQQKTKYIETGEM